MTRITVGWPSGTREIERSETPQRSIDLENSCQFCLLFIAMYCCHHFDNFQVVLTQNMEFCVLRTGGWPRPSHNLESQEVLHVEMVCHEEKVKSHLTLQSSNKHCPLRDRQCSSSDRSRQKSSRRTEYICFCEFKRQHLDIKDWANYRKGHLIVEDECLGSHCGLLEKVENIGKAFPRILLPVQATWI